MLQLSVPRCAMRLDLTTKDEEENFLLDIAGDEKDELKMMKGVFLASLGVMKAVAGIAILYSTAFFIEDQS